MTPMRDNSMPIQQNSKRNGRRLATTRSEPAMSIPSETHRSSNQFKNDPTVIFASLINASMLLRKLPLAEGFEEDDAGGDGDVQGFDRAGGGKGNEEVAAFARQFVEALALAAENNADG